MKKTLRFIAVVMVAAILCMTLASCGKTLSGTYSAEVFGTGVEYTFSGSKVTIALKVLGMEAGTAEGKYAIKDGKITFEFESEDEDVKEYSGTFDFEEGEDYIKIGTFGKFTKKS